MSKKAIIFIFVLTSLNTLHAQFQLSGGFSGSLPVQDETNFHGLEIGGNINGGYKMGAMRIGLGYKQVSNRLTSNNYIIRFETIIIDIEPFAKSGVYFGTGVQLSHKKIAPGDIPDYKENAIGYKFYLGIQKQIFYNKRLLLDTSLEFNRSKFDPPLSLIILNIGLVYLL